MEAVKLLLLLLSVTFVEQSNGAAEENILRLIRYDRASTNIGREIGIVVSLLATASVLGVVGGAGKPTS